MYGMNKKKFTVRVGEDAWQAARDYADEHDTTLTDLVDAFFQSLQRVNAIRTDTPVLLRLAGSLRPDATINDYYEHLERKYLDRGQSDSE